MALGWYSTSEIPRVGWTCGYCGKDVGGNVGYRRGETHELKDDSKLIYICPHCENPTAFIEGDFGRVGQIPAPTYGSDVKGLPSDVESAYSEARRCVQYTAYTAAALMLRKLLMHVAVDLGADENKSFAFYVGYLAGNHYIPPNARDWVDALRRYGNEATHEIDAMGETDARMMLDFAEMLLRIVYEFPSKLTRK